MTSFCD